MAYLLGIASPTTWERRLQLFSRPLITGDLLQVAVALTLAYPYGSPQVLSSYAYSSHGQGAPKAAVHSENGILNCGQQAWYCQHRWPEISGMVSSNAMPHSKTKSFMLASWENAALAVLAVRHILCCAPLEFCCNSLQEYWKYYCELAP